MLDVRCLMLDVRYLLLEVRCWKFDSGSWAVWVERYRYGASMVQGSVSMIRKSFGSHRTAGYGCRAFVTRDDSLRVCNAHSTIRM